MFRKLIRISRFDLFKELLLATPIDAAYYNSLHHSCIDERNAQCSDVFIDFYAIHFAAAKDVGKLAVFAEKKLFPSKSIVKFLDFGIPCADMVEGFKIVDINKPVKVSVYFKNLVAKNGTTLCENAYSAIMDKFWLSRASISFATQYGLIVEKMVGANGVTDPAIMERFLPLLVFGLPKFESEPLILKLIKNAVSFPTIYENVHLECLEKGDWLCTDIFVNHYRTRVQDYPSIDALFVKSSEKMAAIQHLRIYTDIWTLSTATKLKAFEFVKSSDVERFDYFYSTLVDSGSMKVESQEALSALLDKSDCRIHSTTIGTTESCRKTIELVQNNPILDSSTLETQLKKFVKAVDQYTIMYQNIQSRDIVLQGILLNSPSNESLYTDIHIQCIVEKKENCKKHFMDFYELREIKWMSHNLLVQPAINAHMPFKQLIELVKLGGVTIGTASHALTQLALTKRLNTLSKMLVYPNLNLIRIEKNDARKVISSVMSGDLSLIIRFLTIPMIDVIEVQKAIDDYKKNWSSQDPKKVELLANYIKKYELTGTASLQPSL